MRRSGHDTDALAGYREQRRCLGGMGQGSKQLQQFSLEICSAASVQREPILPPDARAIAPIGFVHPDVCRSYGCFVDYPMSLERRQAVGRLERFGHEARAGSKAPHRRRKQKHGHSQARVGRRLAAAYCPVRPGAAAGAA